MSILNNIKKTLSGLTGEDNSPAALRAQREAVAQEKSSQSTESASTSSTSAPRSVSYQRPTVIPQTTPEDVYAKMEAGEDVTLLDIRMPWDHQGQHPAGCTSLPINELQLRLGELKPAQHYVLSCYHGFSSQDATAFLLAQGFNKVESMEGGFSGWAAAGLPVEGRYVG